MDNPLKKTFLISFFLLLQINLAHAEKTSELCIEDSHCTFVLLSELNTNPEKNSLNMVNKKRASQRLSPFSTFKITNSLIGLELGFIKNIEQTLTYDKNNYPSQAWWPPVWKLPHYNLSSAFKYSMVPIYRQLANDIGEADMQSYVDRFSYGNQDISSQLDNFWLNGSLKISALEQVHFLQRVYHNEFNLKTESLTALKAVMLVEEIGDTKIYAKTGAGKVADGSMLGWYVGFVENSQGVYFFAFNVNRDTYAEMKASRVKMAMDYLREFGVINP
jgi:beta-lactamase class D